jgi:hypothetical protein
MKQSRDVIIKAINDYYSGGYTDTGSSSAPDYPNNDFDDECSEAPSIEAVCHERLHFVDHEALFVVGADWNVSQYGTLTPFFFPDDHMERAVPPSGFNPIHGMLYEVDPHETDATYIETLQPLLSELWDKKRDAQQRVEAGELRWVEGITQVADWLRTTDLVDPERVPVFSPLQPVAECHQFT